MICQIPGGSAPSAPALATPLCMQLSFNYFSILIFFSGQNWTYDLSLPSIRYALPHVVQSPKSLSPAFKWSKGRSQVSMVLGIPTVKRDHQSYLQVLIKKYLILGTCSIGSQHVKTCLKGLQMVQRPFTSFHGIAAVKRKIGAFILIFTLYIQFS